MVTGKEAVRKTLPRYYWYSWGGLLLFSLLVMLWWKDCVEYDKTVNDDPGVIIKTQPRSL